MNKEIRAIETRLQALREQRVGNVTDIFTRKGWKPGQMRAVIAAGPASSLEDRASAGRLGEFVRR